MALNKEKGIQVLKKTIQKDIRHRDYKHVCELAERYTQYITGAEVEKQLVQFRPRVSDEEFKQLCELFQSTTPDVANRLMTPMYKVGRTTPVRSITWDDKETAEDKMKKLDDALLHFYGDQSLTDYLTLRMTEMDCMDANSFIVTEFEGAVNPNDPNSLANPYPFEVYSPEAINYKYINNKLQFLIVLNTIEELERYTLYLADVAIVAQEIKRKDVAAYINENPKAVIWMKDEDNEESKRYVITEFEHKAGRIPAMRVGSRRDLTTKGRTRVPLIHPAESYFKKLIKTVSEFDLTNCLHVFQQKIQYDEVCPGDLQKGIMCNGGKVMYGADSNAESTCTICKGTGFKTHTSSQDIIRVKYPKNLDNGFPSLENFISYKGPKMDLLEFQKKLGLYELPELAVKAVYASEIFSPDSIATTATEKSFDMESVYDTLKTFADQWAAMYKHCVLTIAAYRDVSKGMRVVYQFPKDFKMKSMAVLLTELQQANTCGAASHVKQEINRDIQVKMYEDQPYKLLKAEVKDKFYPFLGKTENEIMNIITNDLCSKRKKILYANFDSIFDDIEYEQNVGDINFYKMEDKKQRDIVNAKLDQYIEEIDQDNFNSSANSIGTFGKPDGEVKDDGNGQEDETEEEEDEA